MRWAVALLALALGGCAVKGYDLGWRHEGPLTPLLGAPLDALSGCRWSADASGEGAACKVLASRLGDVLSAQPPLPEAIEALGARCRGTTCTYANTYDRRDVGLAAVVPVYKRVALREMRMRIVLEEAGARLITLTIRDNAPPGYGPVRVGASP